jgi:hypothetical protein
VGQALYGTLGEFRDLGWTIDYYGFGDRYLHGATFGSVVVPLLPAPAWRLVGIDKSQIYAQSSASMLADAMGQTTGQRVGIYGEFFMNSAGQGLAWRPGLRSAHWLPDGRFPERDPQKSKDWSWGL